MHVCSPASGPDVGSDTLKTAHFEVLFPDALLGGHGPLL